MWEKLKECLKYDQREASILVLADSVFDRNDPKGKELYCDKVFMLTRLTEWLYGEPGHENNICMLDQEESERVKGECRGIQFPALAVFDAEHGVFKVMGFRDALKWLAASDRYTMIIDGVNMAPYLTGTRA